MGREVIPKEQGAGGGEKVWRQEEGEEGERRREGKGQGRPGWRGARHQGRRELPGGGQPRTASGTGESPRREVWGRLCDSGQAGGPESMSSGEGTHQGTQVTGGGSLTVSLGSFKNC